MRRQDFDRALLGFILLVAVAFTSLAFLPLADGCRLEEETRRCKVCPKACCPDKTNCSCLSKDVCSCVKPEDIPSPGGDR